MTELEKLKAGETYDYRDPEVQQAHVRAVQLCDRFNASERTELALREEILRELFGSLGKNPFVEKNIREYGKPITVGSDVWIGGHVTVCPGVTIGDNVVIGAGSVVVHDIPSDSVAVGNPARVVKSLPPRKA